MLSVVETIVIPIGALCFKMDETKVLDAFARIRHYSILTAFYFLKSGDHIIFLFAT